MLLLGSQFRLRASDTIQEESGCLKSFENVATKQNPIWDRHLNPGNERIFWFDEKRVLQGSRALQNTGQSTKTPLSTRILWLWPPHASAGPDWLVLAADLLECSPAVASRAFLFVLHRAKLLLPAGSIIETVKKVILFLEFSGFSKLKS